jgi:hypothetical protein
VLLDFLRNQLDSMALDEFRVAWGLDQVPTHTPLGVGARRRWR